MLVAMINWWIWKKKRSVVSDELAYDPSFDFSDARNSMYIPMIQGF